MIFRRKAFLTDILNKYRGGITPNEEDSMSQLPFNACDYRCEHCLVTGECAVYRQLQERSLGGVLDDPAEDDYAAILHAIRESFRETEARIKQKAREAGIDIDEMAGDSSAGNVRTLHRSAGDDPLYKRVFDFSKRSLVFLDAARAEVAAEAYGYLDDIAWHHTVVAAKVYRALGWSADREGADDAVNSAAVAAKSLTICAMAFDYLAPRYPSLSRDCNKLADEARGIKEEIMERIRPARAA